MTPKFSQLRGDFALRNITKGETVFTPVFDATTGALNFNVSTEKVPGTGNKPGTIFTYETARASTLTITAKSRHLYLLEQNLLGESNIIAASTAPMTFALPALKKGQIFELPAKNITAITAGALVRDVDFEVFAKSGTLQALADTAATPACTVEHGEYDEIGIFSADAQHFEILFFSEVSGQSYKLYDGLLVPSGDFSLVQESGIGEAQVVFELSQSKTAVADARLGKYGRGYNVA